MSEQSESEAASGCSQRMVSLLERSKCYCHELRNSFNERHGRAGDDTSDILEHIDALEAELVRLKQANDPSSATRPKDD